MSAPGGCTGPAAGSLPGPGPGCLPVRHPHNKRRGILCALHKIPRRPAVPRPICRPAPAGGRNVCSAAVSRRWGPRYHGEQVCILWRTMCAATGAQVSAQSVQNAETVAANIVRHGRSMGEGRTGPAGTCAPPRLCGERVRVLWRTLCAATGGTGVGAGRTKCRDRSGEHCSPWPFDGRGAYRSGRNVCPAAALRRTGPHFVAHAVRRYRWHGGWRRAYKMPRP